MARRDLETEAHDDLRVFLFLMWKHLGLPAPTPAQYAFAYYLQHGPQRRGLLCFRGVGKSWVTAAFVIWRLWRDPQRKMLIISASADRAVAFSTFCKRVIAEWDLVQHLRPRKGQRDSVENWDVGPSAAAQAPSVKSVGITGQFTGTRAHDIVFDDAEVPKNSETVTMREKLGELVKEAAAVYVPDCPDITITYLGTPQTEDTLYCKLPERGYRIKIWPAQYPDSDLREQYAKMNFELFDEVADAIDRGAEIDTPTDPARFDEVDLSERLREYGRTAFAMQFMLNPALSDAERYPLKLRDLVVMDCDNEIAPAKVVWAGGPEQTLEGLPSVGMAGDRWQERMVVKEKDGTEMHGWAPYTGTVMSIDPSGRGADETSYAVVKFLRGQLFLVAWGGFAGDGYSDEVMTKLALIAKQHGIKAFQIESNFGDGMFTRLFTPVLRRECGYGPGAPDECEVRHNTQKEVRIIDALGPVMGQHKLVIDTKVVRSDFHNVPDGEVQSHMRRGFFQMTRITRDRGCLRHDDRIDVLAMAVKYWTDRMGVDTDQAARDAKDALLDEEIQRMQDRVLGRTTRVSGILARGGVRR